MGLFDRFRGEPHSRVRMVASVGGHVAGELYDVPVSVADRWIARGYALGNFSRPYDEHELAALRGNSAQVVNLGG
jgi:hypothetical protein